MSTRNRLIIGLVGVFVIVGAGISYVIRMQRPIQRDGIEGTIVKIDVAARTATLEIIHPKTGKPINITGEVAPDCVILRDGQQITMADLEPGEAIDASGLLYPLTQRIVATRVEVVPPETDDADAATDTTPATEKSAVTSDESKPAEAPRVDSTDVANS